MDASWLPGYEEAHDAFFNRYPLGYGLSRISRVCVFFIELRKNAANYPAQ